MIDTAPAGREVNMDRAWTILLAVLLFSPPALARAMPDRPAPGVARDDPAGSDEVGILRIGDMTALRLPAAGRFNSLQRVAFVRHALLKALPGEPGSTATPAELATTIGVAMHHQTPVVTCRGVPVVSITAADTAYHGLPAQDLANRYAAGIRRALLTLPAERQKTIETFANAFQTAVVSRDEAGEPEAVTASRDETIVGSIRQRLETDPTFRQEHLARELAIEAVNGRVIVRGTVRNRRIEARLIGQIERMPGVEAVVNQVEVHEPVQPQ
jgi:hypothetical protein